MTYGRRRDLEDARMTDDGDNAKPVLTEEIYDRRGFAHQPASGSIDLGLRTNQDRERIYHMANQPAPSEAGRSMSQTYYEEVEALKAKGVNNADAVRQVAEKHGKNENAVRGGIHQYKSRHVNGGSPAPATRRSRRASLSVDDYLANARHALESARDLVDREVEQAKAALDAAQARYDEVQASVKERKADIEKKLKALS